MITLLVDVITETITILPHKYAIQVLQIDRTGDGSLSRLCDCIIELLDITSALIRSSGPEE